MKALILLPLGVIGPWQWVIIALVIILLFGGKKIPELMRGLGKGMKEFKKGMNDVENDIKEIDADLNSTAKTPEKIEKIEENKQK
ncbi:MAG: twin-arginine translocase TatA/TatE family subunit [Candidatus Cryptobacteroides sp.]|nr:twin-arginine translocase TatA/TatE family subunit [Candidatus Cryptobacteroides sp.]